MPLTGTPQPELFDGDRTLPVTSIILGVPDRAVMEIMGWSHAAMTSRYQHLTGAVRADIAGRVGGLLWGFSEETTHAARYE